jgi:elongation factor P
MLTTADFGKGVRILMNNEPYTILDVSMQTASGRGSNTLVKFKARNLLTGKLVSEAVKAGTKFEEPDLRYGNVQYLYSEGDQAVFMDQESYEQFNLALEVIGEQARYLSEEVKLKAMYFNGTPVSVEFPMHVPMKVSSVEPADRGNTATGSIMTRAELEGGYECQVPVHVKSCDTILVNTTDHTFYQRVQ